MEITGLNYFTKRALAAHKQQLGFLGVKTILQTTTQGHKDSSSHTVSMKGHTDMFFVKTENREIHILNKVSTMTITHPLGDKYVFVGSKTKLAIEKPLSRDD